MNSTNRSVALTSSIQHFTATAHFLGNTDEAGEKAELSQTAETWGPHPGKEVCRHEHQEAGHSVMEHKTPGSGDSPGWDPSPAQLRLWDSGQVADIPERSSSQAE